MNQNPTGQVIINFNCGHKPQEETPQPKKSENHAPLQKMPGQQPRSACGGSIRPGHQPLHCLVQNAASQGYEPAIKKNSRFPSSVLKPANPSQPGPGQPPNKLRRPAYDVDPVSLAHYEATPPQGGQGRYNPVTLS